MKETKYLSIEQTNCLKGIFAILVLIHHVYQYGGLFRGSYIGSLFQLFGFISVAMFFFFSGYGLMFSSSKENYLTHFFRKRFLPLYCFNIFLIAIHSICTLLIQKDISILKIVQSFFYGGTVIANGWYLQATFFVYLLYLLVFKIFKSPKTQILVYSLCILLYCVVCRLINLGINWYQTIPCVVLGMIYCNRKNAIDALLKKHSWLMFLLTGIAFAASFVLSSVSSFKIFFGMLYCLFFVCAMISLNYILCDTHLIANKFTSLCGKYSLEIYVTHGLFLGLIKYIKNIPLYIIIIIIGTVISSFIAKKVYLKIIALFNKKPKNA